MHQVLMLCHASVLLQLNSMCMPRWGQLHVSSIIMCPQFLACACIVYPITVVLYPLVVLPGCHTLVVCVGVANVVVGPEVDVRIY